MSHEDRVRELNLDLTSAPRPMGVYQPMVVVGNLAFLSGHGPLQSDGSLLCGRVGENADETIGYQAARQTGLAMLATLRHGLGSLDRVQRVVKVMGLVNCVPDFTQHPAVINGCSELFAEVFGMAHGVAARSAFGAASLPGGMLVEIEAVFEIA